MNYTEIIEKTYEVVKEIKNSEIYKKYQKYKKLVDTDKEFNKLLKEFNEIRDKFSEVYNYRKYYKDYDVIKKQYQQTKIIIMNNNLYKNYKLYEKKVEKYLQKIELQLKELVNIKEKHGKIILR